MFSAWDFERDKSVLWERNHYRLRFCWSTAQLLLRSELCYHTMQIWKHGSGIWIYWLLMPLCSSTPSLSRTAAEQCLPHVLIHLLQRYVLRDSSESARWIISTCTLFRVVMRESIDTKWLWDVRCLREYCLAHCMQSVINSGHINT